MTTKDWLSIAWILLILIITTVMGFRELTGEMITLATLGGIGLFAFQMDKFESFKGPGIHAQMRKTVDEANATLDQVKEIAQVVAKISVSDMGLGNFLAGMPIRAQFQYRDELENALKKLQISQAHIYKVDALWLNAVQQMYFNEIIKYLPKTTISSPEDHSKKVSSKQILSNFREVCTNIRAEISKSNKLKTWLSNNNLLNGEVAMLIDELIEYETSRTYPENSFLFMNDKAAASDIDLVELFEDQLDTGSK